MTDHARRIDDTGIWRWFRLYPVFTGIVLAAVSMGGYLATIKYMSAEISSVQAQQMVFEKAAQENTSIISRIVALQESMDRRVTRLENLQDQRERRH